MNIDCEKEHEILYSGAPLLLGKSFGYILRADTLVRAIQDDPQGLKEHVSIDESRALTLSADEISSKEIHWWVYQQENNHQILFKRTEEALSNLQRLKEAAERLDPQNPKNYSEIIVELKNFCDSHYDKILAFNKYVQWLANIDPIAPIILFSHQRWGGTRRFNHQILVSERFIENDSDDVKRSTELVLGIRYSRGWNLFDVYYDMDNENYERDPEEYQNTTVDKNILIFRTSHQIFKEFGIFLGLIRDSLRDIIREIEGFNSEILPVVRTLKFGERTKQNIRFAFAQLDYSLRPITEYFGFIPENEELLREKIISAIRIAQENSVDLICFPELSFKKEWIGGLFSLYPHMMIVCGSYYENSYNVCPVIIRGQLVEPPYKKHNPSPSERGVILGSEMKPGKFVYIFRTSIGIFSTLTCVDYAELSHHLISQSKDELDFIINPCYDTNIKRFQSQCNSDCENYNLTIIQANRAEDEFEKYGRSCVISKEHSSQIRDFSTKHLRDADDEKYLLFKLKNEEMAIFDIDFSIKAPPVDTTIHYPGRVKILKIYQYFNEIWMQKPNI